MPALPKNASEEEVKRYSVQSAVARLTERCMREYMKQDEVTALLRKEDLAFRSSEIAHSTYIKLNRSIGVIAFCRSSLAQNLSKSGVQGDDDVLLKCSDLLMSKSEHIISLQTSDEIAIEAKKLLRGQLNLSDDESDAIVISKGVRKSIDAIASQVIDLRAMVSDATYVVSKHLMQVIFNAAQSLGSTKVFASAGHFEKTKNRHVPTPAAISTPIVRQLLAYLASDTSVNVTAVVGGPSGSGKTFGVVALSSLEHHRIVVNIQTEQTTIVSGVKEVLAEEHRDMEARKKARDDLVLDLVASCIDAAVPPEACEAMKTLPVDGPKLKVIVCLDEVGPYSDVVRALCSLTGERLRLKVMSLWKADRLHIDFYIVAAGTGIGFSKGFTPTNDNGATLASGASDYAYFSTESSNTFEGTNLEIFRSHLLPEDKKEASRSSRSEETSNAAASRESPDEISLTSLKERVNPLLLRLVCGNARLASCAGELISQSLKGAFSQDDVNKMLLRIDLGTFIGPAIMKFKSLNALTSVAADDLFEYLLKAVKMHYYPYAADAAAAHKFESRYGLVQNLTLAKRSPTQSPIRLPPFSIFLLSEMVGIEDLTRSIVIGESLAAYVFSVFSLLAFCAGSSGAFAKALGYDSGLMRSFGPSDGEVSDEHADETVRRAVELCPLMHDMSRKYMYENASDLTENATMPTQATAASTAVGYTSSTRIAEAVKERLEAHKAYHKAEKGGSSAHVAFFRSPDKAAFADVFGLIGDTVFFFGVKDVASAASVNADVERWKMGAADANHYADLGKKAAHCPRAIIGAIAKAWKDLTDIPLRHVRPYFVFSLNRCATDMAKRLASCMADATIALDDSTATLHRAQAVSIEDIEFLRFSRSEKAPAPELAKHIPRTRVEQADTPDAGSAPDVNSAQTEQGPATGANTTKRSRQLAPKRPRPEGEE